LSVAKPVSLAEVARLAAVVAQLHNDQDSTPPKAEVAAATRIACALLASRYPGGTVELRVPPYAAVQLGLGDRGRHTRGTPPNVVETDPISLLLLASGALSWTQARHGHRVRASGTAADLTSLWPLPELS
jgi:hypothetical protein